MRFLNGGEPISRTVFTTKIFPVYLDYNPRDPLFGFWILEAKPTRTFLGWVSYRPSDTNHRDVTIGFRLRKSAWGSGYATEGARAIIAKGFAETNVQCVKATTYEANLASQRVLNKLGMQLVRKFRLTQADLELIDTYQTDVADLWEGDDFEYMLTKTEWEQGLTELN